MVVYGSWLLDDSDCVLRGWVAQPSRRTLDRRRTRGVVRTESDFFSRRRGGGRGRRVAGVRTLDAAGARTGGPRAGGGRAQPDGRGRRARRGRRVRRRGLAPKVRRTPRRGERPRRGRRPGPPRNPR